MQTSCGIACVSGDGESETGPLATNWYGNTFLNPAADGAVLPILHLNGCKISNPTVPARVTREELEHLIRGYGDTPDFVEGDEAEKVHQQLAGTLDAVVAEIKAIPSQSRSAAGAAEGRPRGPMIVLVTPRGWTGPKTVDGLPVEGTFRAWMRSDRSEELFDEAGTLHAEIAAIAPEGERRMAANPQTNGGLLLRTTAKPRSSGSKRFLNRLWPGACVVRPVSPHDPSLDRICSRAAAKRAVDRTD